MDERVSTLPMLRSLARSMGYTFVVDQDGTERMYRPDGSLAIIATRRSRTAPTPTQSVGDNSPTKREA